MLELIRQRAQGLVVGVIIGLICITFALWGVQEYLGAGGDPTVVEVAGDEIPASDFYRYYAQLERSAQVMGEGLDPAQFERAEFRNAQLEAFARSELVERVAERQGFRVPDEAVVGNLTGTPIFQADGKFSVEAYRRALDVLGFTSSEYEARLRDALAVSQYRFGIGGSAIATLDEARRLAAVRAETRDLGFVLIRRSGFEPEIDADDIAGYYETNTEAFREPERLDVRYLSLDLNRLAEDIAIPEARIREYYESNPAEFVSEEERNVSHILIQVGEDASEDEVASARARLVELVERAKGGESFEALAEEYSDDVASRAEGGETGLFPRGVMEPAFEEAAFSLGTEGEISEPIRTKFGLHVLKLKEIAPETTAPFDEVRDRIETTLQRAEAEEVFYEMAERLDAPVFENPETLEVAADELGLTIRSTGLKSRDELAAVFSPKVIDALYSEDVHDAGLNSLPIDDGPNRIVVVRIGQMTPERAQSLDEVRNEVERILVRKRSAEAAKALGDEWLEALRDGAAPEAVVADSKFEWSRVDGANRRSTKVNRAVLREAFSLRPAQDGPRYFGLQLGSGDYAVVSVDNRQIPAPDAISDTEADALRRDLNSMRGNGGWEYLTAELERRYDVETFPDRL